jgi:hypothetical protein
MLDAGETVIDDVKMTENKVVEEWNEIKRVAMDACKCSNYDCGCCAHLEEREIHLNSTGK